jgi:hypothetical protein
VGFDQARQQLQQLCVGGRDSVLPDACQNAVSMVSQTDVLQSAQQLQLLLQGHENGQGHEYGQDLRQVVESHTHVVHRALQALPRNKHRSLV